jgi:hypothetical protein
MTTLVVTYGAAWTSICAYAMWLMVRNRLVIRRLSELESAVETQQHSKADVHAAA